MDDDLSARARQLIDAAMEEDVPPPAIEDGSWEVVISRLTVEAAREPVTLPAPRRGWVVLVVVALVVVVAGGLLWLVLQPAPKPAAVEAPATAPVPASAPPQARAVPEQRPAPAIGPHDSIDPAKLLDEAEAAEPTRALELLSRHAELAALGPDMERRMALRIAALCELGRDDDARAEARAFLSERRDPKWEKQVRASCAGRSPPR